MSAFLGATESLLSSNKLSPCVQIEHDECHVSATDGMVSPASAACGKGRIREAPLRTGSPSEHHSSLDT